MKKVVVYNPNGVDYAVRPKNSPVPAFVVSKAEQEIEVKDEEGKKEKKTREVVNLVVLVDSDPCVVRKQRVPHKDDALEGESFYE